VNTKQQITVPIFGLSCSGGGSLLAEQALGKLPGVSRVYVNPATEMAYIEYNPVICDAEQIHRAIEHVGLKTDFRSARTGL
jgi:copper chaperone CopZ